MSNVDILSKRPYDLSHSLCTLVAVASSSFLNNARNEIISPSIDLYTLFLDQYYPETIKRASNECMGSIEAALRMAIHRKNRDRSDDFLSFLEQLFHFEPTITLAKLL